MNLLELSDMEDEDQELVPEILPVDARLSISGNAQRIAALLQSALEVVPIKEIIPNTGYVLLEGFPTTEKHISYGQVSATDGERSIALLDDSISVKLAGSALVPGKRLLNILKLVPESTVRIDVMGTTATVRAGRAVWTLSTPPADYGLPAFSNTENITLHSVSSKNLLRALELVHPAVAKTSARQSLMQVEVSKSHLTACDGIRAHRIFMEELPKTLSTTLPLRFVETAMKELRGLGDSVVEFGADNSTVVLHFGRNILMSQRLNFDYPAVDHLMLEPALLNDDKLTVNVQELIDTVKRVRVNSDPDYFALFLSLRPTKDTWTLTVRSRDKDNNASQESFQVEYEGVSAAKDITVNHKYLLDFLSCVSSEEVTLKLGESTKTKQSPIYVEDEGFVGSLMVMAPNVVR